MSGADAVPRLGRALVQVRDGVHVVVLHVPAKHREEHPLPRRDSGKGTRMRMCLVLSWRALKAAKVFDRLIKKRRYFETKRRFWRQEDRDQKQEKEGICAVGKRPAMIARPLMARHSEDQHDTGDDIKTPYLQTRLGARRVSNERAS
eukprot:5158533-Pleurochrysis_carterae.AAC.1